MSQPRKRQQTANLSRALLHFWWMFLCRFALSNRQIVTGAAFCPRSQRATRRASSRLIESKFFASIETRNFSDNMVQEDPPKPIKAKLVSTASISECGERLRKGDLVAFPTETVYGLGCNALDPEAIVKVFQAKERPLTDPLITHVTNNQVAFDLWDAPSTSLEGKALRILCTKFWPGPLTLVSKAAPHVPSILMAGTGFVACRAPQHPISISLINAAEVPLAAPSANKFGHVSPTRAHHVWDDLLYEDVWILDTGEENTDGICDVGVESSVAKIEMDPESDEKGKITLLRQGAVSVQDIRQCLDEAGLSLQFKVEAHTKKASDETVATVAPGQTIRHYSPDIPSYILSQSRYEASTQLSTVDREILSKSVLIDFGGKLKAWKNLALAYRELSDRGDSSEATKAVFETLRWAERVNGATQILFPEILENETHKHEALTLALKDRLTRAASGVVVDSLN